MEAEESRGTGGAMVGLARRCERLVLATGQLCSWLLVLLVAVIVAQVVMRYAFGKPMNALGELQWHFYALVGIAGLSYTMAERGHVRVDIFYAKYPRRVARWVDALGLALLVIPLGVFLCYEGFKFAFDSFLVAESSPEPDGLPFRWFIKGALPLGALILVVEAAARLVLTFAGGREGDDGKPES